MTPAYAGGDAVGPGDATCAAGAGTHVMRGVMPGADAWCLRARPRAQYTARLIFQGPGLRGRRGAARADRRGGGIPGHNWPLDLQFRREDPVKGRVLIIDDEPEIRRNLTIGLTQEGYTVVACPDGISAIHELNRASERGVGFHYLVTDIFMPDIDGLKILKVIKSQYPELPVLVITGFGDDRLKFTALSEKNTGYLDKPFEIPELVEALERLSPGTTTLKPSAAAADEGMRESVSAYLTLKITDPARSMEIYNELCRLSGVVSCHAVRGDVDIILLGQADGQAGIDALFGRVKAMPGVEVASVSAVERPKLDRDVNEFVDVYQKAVKTATQETAQKQPGTASYIIVDIDRDAIQQIFTTVFFIEEVIFCDVIDDGAKLVGMITGQGAVGRTPRIIEKISEIEGVLRVREAKVIKMLDD
jgi:two-component system chemotaxis response regulator CheY